MTARVCVVTATRAEFGLLTPLLRELSDASWCELQLVVTGGHLVPELGDTWRLVEAMGFRIDRMVDLELSCDSEVAIARSAGLALSRFADVFEELGPDLVVVLGDRYEMLSVALAAYLQRLSVVHLYGGDVTAGALDDGLRHAITKLSRLHFTATEESRARVIQLGEDPDTVYAVGALGVDVALTEATLPEAETRELLGVQGDRPYVMVTYHPETVLGDGGAGGLSNLLAVLDQREDLDVVLTASNADALGREFTARLRAWADDHPGRGHFVASLGSPGYVCAVRWAAAVLGNSSSGVVEAPSLRTPTVNIGNRQTGRPSADSVIDVPGDATSIADGLARVLDPNFADLLDGSNPWGDGRATSRIVKLLDSRGSEVAGTPKPPFRDQPHPFLEDAS